MGGEGSKRVHSFQDVTETTAGDAGISYFPLSAGSPLRPPMQSTLLSRLKLLEQHFHDLQSDCHYRIFILEDTVVVLRSDNNDLRSNNERLHDRHHSRVSKLERMVVSLQSKNERLASFRAYGLGFFAHAEDLVVDLAGRLDVLEKKHPVQVGQKGGRFLDLSALRA